ncbi:MAG: hypothetical protein ACFFC3_15080, partial [Candidatus Odinarchaeota archaeon]
WMGNKVIPAVAKHKFNPEYIDTQLKIHGITDNAIIIETKLGIMEYFPKDQLILGEDTDKIQMAEWYNIKIPLWLYNKRRNIFGIA